MLPTNLTKNSRIYRALLFLATFSTATALFSFPAISDAIELTLSPSINTDLIFTDNVNLGPKGEERADFVTRLMPGIYGTAKGRRFDGEIDYRMINTIFARETDRSRTFHSMRGKAVAEIYKDFFFVETNAAMRQQNRSLLGPQGDTANTTNNLTNIQQYRISPYIRKRIAGLASTEFRVARVWTSSSDPASYYNSQANTYTGTVLSGPDFQVLEWGLYYNKQDIDYQLRPETVTLQTGIGSVKYNITHRFGLTGTGGYEDNNFGGGGVRPRGARWSAGFVWIPNERTRIEASGGQRFFGDTYAYNFSHRRRLTAFTSSYREDVRGAFGVLGLDETGDTTTILTNLFTAQAAPGTDPAVIAQAVQDVIAGIGLPGNLADTGNFLTNRFFLQKTFLAAAAANGASNTLVFRVFKIRRQPIDSNPLLDDLLPGGGSLVNTNMIGGTAAWSVRISNRNSATLALSYTEVEYPSLARKDKIKGISFRVSRQLSEKVSAALMYRRRERETTNDLGTDTFGGYAENRMMASLYVRF